MRISQSTFAPLRRPALGGFGFDIPFDWAGSGASSIIEETGTSGFDWGSLISSGLTTGFDVWRQRQATERAEEERKAFEARAAADRATAERLRSGTQTSEGGNEESISLVPGVPNTTLLLVGGIAAAGLVAFIAFK